MNDETWVLIVNKDTGDETAPDPVHVGHPVPLDNPIIFGGDVFISGLLYSPKLKGMKSQINNNPHDEH